MAACGGNGEGAESIEAEFEVPMEVLTEERVSGKLIADDQVGQNPLEKKIIKTSGLTYRVENTKDEYLRIGELLKKYDAYIGSESENKGYDRINYNLNIKVSPQYFDVLISELTKDKKLDNKWMNTDDVSERYYDLEARIENKKKLEIRYQEILKQASKVSDILEVERNLNQVRSEIESLQGQFKFLNHQINYSSIDISFYELIPYEYDQEQRPGFGTRILNALSGGWNGFLSFTVFAVTLWPFALLTFLLILFIRRMRRRNKKDDL